MDTTPHEAAAVEAAARAAADRAALDSLLDTLTARQVTQLVAVVRALGVINAEARR